MKVVGFTIVRNAIKFDYPVVESINSILPVCDEFVVNVGKSDDDTLNLIKSIGSPKIKIMESVWDDSLRKGGLRLAVETNKTMDAIGADADWLFYIQADEVMHESGVGHCKKAMEQHKDDKKVEGLLLRYHHFYGSYSYVVDLYSHWYNEEVRIIRNNKHIRSFKDAQGFRRYSTTNPNLEEISGTGDKLNVKQINATMFHYGWVKNPSVQKVKRDSFEEMWHDDEWVKNNSAGKEYDYSNITSIVEFKGAHPSIMTERIKQKNWDFKPAPLNISFRQKILRFLQYAFGLRVGEYRNYKLI